MIEMRWVVKKEKREWHDGMSEMVNSEPVLQYREKPTGENFQNPPSYEWEDVPTVCYEY